MQIARVIGDVVATQKDPAYNGIALLVIQPLASDGSDSGRALVAVDSVGAGVGETVFFVRGKEASFPFYPVEVPADAGIVGIVDHWTTMQSAVPPATPDASRANDLPAAREVKSANDSPVARDFSRANHPRVGEDPANHPPVARDPANKDKK